MAWIERGGIQPGFHSLAAPRIIASNNTATSPRLTRGSARAFLKGKLEDDGNLVALPTADARAAARSDRVVCVMCGTRPGGRRQDADAARELGRSLAELSLTVLYGGGGTGLMGALADGVLAGGGRVEGVMPRAFLDYGLGHEGLSRMHVMPGLAAQQAAMLERSDAFIALPGGLGTLYELIAALAHGQMGLHSKPILLLNAAGYFDRLLGALQLTAQLAFASWDDFRLLHSFENVADLAAAIADWRDGIPGSPLVCSVAANRTRAAEVEALARHLADPDGPGSPDRRFPVQHAAAENRLLLRQQPIDSMAPAGWPRRPQHEQKHPVRLHLVYGPTGSGKTDRATALAQQTGAPVIVLDRIQCHSALAAGSGRPAEADIAGTRRLYLCDRAVTAGELPPAEAYRLLAAHVGDLTASEPLVILEGGSVSVLKLMRKDPAWERFTWSIDRRPLRPPEQYLPGAVERARGMLQPPDGRPGLLEELAAAWAHPPARPTLLSVFTYRVAIHGVQRAGLAVERAAGISGAARRELVQELAAALHAHAQWQDREILEPPASWPRTKAPAATEPQVLVLE
jgi:uncharacterized protein (TIGR00730 family)